MSKRMFVSTALAVGLFGLPALAFAESNDDSAGRTGYDRLDPELLSTTMEGIHDAGAPGVLAQVRDGEEVWSSALGTRVLGQSTPVETDDRLRVSSITRSMVTTIVLQLKENGDLRLDDPISGYLPGILPYDAPITIRQLLDHTSGIPDYRFNIYTQPEAIAADLLKEFTPVELVKLGTDRPLRFAPGSDHYYSFTNTVVIGLLIEELTGRTVEEELRERILSPLEMSNSYFPKSELEISGPHPDGYLMMWEPQDPFIDTSAQHPSQCWAGCGLVSTTGDVNDFYRAMFDGTLLTPASIAEAQQATAQSEGSYGLGLNTLPADCEFVPGGIAYGHDGGSFGHTTRSFHSADGSRQVTLTYTVDAQLHLPDHPIYSAVTQFLTAGLCSTDTGPGTGGEPSNLPQPATRESFYTP